MKKSFLLSVILSLIFSSVFAQKKIEGYWGQRGYDVAYACAATNDGGYIITGLTQSAGDSNGDIVVIKTSDVGAPMWSFTMGGPKIEGGNGVMQTADGGYLVSGHTEDFGANDCDAFLMKLDVNGNRQWLKVYGGAADDIAEGAIELPGGGYVFAGITASWGNPATDSETRHVYFVKTSSTGETIWTKYYAGSGAEYAYSIASRREGGFLAVGWSTSFGNGEHDGWLFRLTDNGDTLWTRLYQKDGDTRYNKILPTADNGFVIAGFTTPTKTCKPLGLLIKLDGDGNELWEKTYGDTSTGAFFQDVAQLPNSNFMLTGTSYADDPLGNVYILTTDAAGNSITDDLCGGTNSYANGIALQGNNSYLIAGCTLQYGDHFGDLYYMEIDNTISNVPTVKSTTPRIFPNPVSNEPMVIVLPEQEANQTISIDVMNMSGVVSFSQQDIMAKDIVLDRNIISSGQYVFRITCKDGTVYRGKFVVE